MTELPAVAPSVVAEVLDQLPQRLRKRVDTTLPKAAEWIVSVVHDRCTAEIDTDTTLSFQLRDGILAVGADLTCSCLLSPHCLHRAVAVSVAPVAEALVAVAPEVIPEPLALSASGAAAAGLLWQAAGTVLRAGVSGSGAVIQAELLRAVHTARIAGLHRAAAAALRVVAGIRASHAGSSDFDRTTTTADLSELLLVCHQLRAGTGDIGKLRGTARREYLPVGSLRLFGLCTERVVADSGYAGVVTHLVDSDGGLWTIPAIAPGGKERVAAALDGPVAVGESGLSHRSLSRSGLLLSSATASADRRLGAGNSVRAVAAPGADWSSSPLWQETWESQIRRAFSSEMDLLFLDGTVLGSTGGALQLETTDGTVDLVGSSDVVWENLRLLAGMTGHRLLVVARLLRDRPGTAAAIAASGELALPESWGGRVNLTLERLQRSYVDGVAADPMSSPTVAAPEASPIELLDRWLHRVTLGGRKMPVIGSAAKDQARLTRLGLTGTAQLLGALQATARDENRDAFGRLIPRADDEFVMAWLRGCVHAQAFTQSAAMTAWLQS